MSDNAEINLEQIAEQQNLILSEISSQPYIGPLINPNALITDYNNSSSPGFIPGLEYLSKKYFMRKVRGDGNCFYRALLFSYLEKVLIDYNSESDIIKAKAVNEHKRILQRIKDCRQELIAWGYSEIAFECFYDVRYNII